MSSLRPGSWPLILVHMLLLHIQAVKVQGGDPVSQKIQRLNEQFQEFQELTQALLDMLAQNHSKNVSAELESSVQALRDHWNHMSQDLENLKQSTTQEIQGLREWSRKLEKKSKRMEGRLALMERNLKENCRHAQKQRPDPGLDFSKLTLELQSHEERLAALQAQRDELLMGLKGMQESLKNQALRVTRLEGRLSEVLQQNGGGKPGGLSLPTNAMPQEYYEPLRRSQTHRRRPETVLETPTTSEATGYSQTDDSSQLDQYQATPNQPKPSKTQKFRSESESHQQTQIRHSNPEPRSADYLPQPELDGPESHIQVWTQTKPYQIKSGQTVSDLHTQVQAQLYHQRQSHNPSDSQPLPHSAAYPEPTKDRPSRIGLGTPQPHDRPQPWSKDESESSVIHNFLRLPVRHKIPTRPVPKKDATICNVDSMLFFPSASAENYVTFFHSLPDLPELSVCLWLRVEASHVGTLLSYATEDNDNQLVLYGQNSSTSSSPSSSFHSLDFVMGDPVYRRLPALPLLDARWHHVCILWSSIQGRFWHYRDQRIATLGSNFRKGWEIPGGGSVVLGQEQDTVGGGFDSAEGFAGQVAGFRVWNRVLTPSEVKGVAEGRGVPRGVVLGMEDIKEVHGEVQQVACECLEHCA